ncbi:MAG: 2'-deoxycytidine 5'-triphosphate deaminase, partial [Hyphomicrobiales bacterium]|nr:2'-deoxycytidine 5'-triphosphate deaminase [Hyphomicrobiales bacterium]
MSIAIWPAQRIRDAFAKGVVAADAAPDPDQVQPASLDLRLGPKAYRLPASF